MAQNEAQRPWIAALLLVCAVLLSYSPALKAGFFWDDTLVLTANPVIVGPSGLEEIWTTRAADICPLTLSTFWLEHALWGLAPLPYHVVNMALHVAAALLLWRVLLALRIPGAWIGAALWALHPVQVESVAWVSEMKNTESGVFFLLSILFYITFMGTEGVGKGTPRWLYYFVALLCGFLALAAKTSTIGLPVVLGLCVWWLRRDWHVRRLLQLFPFVLMSGIAGLLTLYAAPVQQADTDPQWQLSWAQHIALVGDSFWFYLVKLVLPYPVGPIYPRWHIDASNALSYLPLLMACAAIAVIWIYRRTWARPSFFALAYYLVMILPVLGLINQFILRYSFVFDHFQYLAGMGPIALAGAGVARLGASLPRAAFYWISAGLVLVLAAWSFGQAERYKDARALWTHAVQMNPGCWLAYNELGNFALNDGDFDQAAALYQKAVELNPRYVKAHSNLGLVYGRKGRYNAALVENQRAVDLDPTDAEAHNDLGDTLGHLSKVNEALLEFQKAASLNPYYAPAFFNLANLLDQVGRYDDAITVYQRALQVDPKLTVARLGLGMAQLHKGDGPGAYASFQQTLQADPNSAEAWNDLGWLLFLSNHLDEAIADYEKAIALNPRFVGAYNNLGWAYLQGKSDPDDAIVQFQQALALKPDYTIAQINLGSAYAQKGDYDHAISQFQAILQANPSDATAKKNLAAIEALKKATKKSAHPQAAKGH